MEQDLDFCDDERSDDESPSDVSCPDCVEEGEDGSWVYKCPQCRGQHVFVGDNKQSDLMSFIVGRECRAARWIARNNGRVEHSQRRVARRTSSGRMMV